MTRENQPTQSIATESWLFIVIGVGIVCLLCLIVLALVCAMKRRRDADGSDETELHATEFDSVLFEDDEAVDNGSDSLSECGAADTNASSSIYGKAPDLSRERRPSVVIYSTASEFETTTNDVATSPNIVYGPIGTIS